MSGVICHIIITNLHTVTEHPWTGWYKLSPSLQVKLHWVHAMLWGLTGVKFIFCPTNDDHLTLNCQYNNYAACTSGTSPGEKNHLDNCTGMYIGQASLFLMVANWTCSFSAYAYSRLQQLENVHTPAH